MKREGAKRGTWASGFGFVLAAAGSAVGLGNLWRFPYITGENGGGAFVFIYLAAIGLVGLPILMSEIVLGRAAGTSAVAAMRSLAGRGSPWVALGWLGVVGPTLILSLYAVVAGWALHYTVLSLRGVFSGLGPDEVQAIFGGLYVNAELNLAWAAIFLIVTTAVVAGGVHEGLERWSQILMPLLLAMLLVLFFRALTLDGFGEAFEFVFGWHTDRLTPAGVLEALGHAFFTLGIGVGIMLTYGSYLRPNANLVKDSVAVAVLDTGVALLACLVIFPITFTFGLEASEGPGLVFTTLPVAFAQLPGGTLLAVLFFALLVFAALTSSISMLESATAYLIDVKGWSRKRAATLSGAIVLVLMIPAALTGPTTFFGSGMAELLGKNWFDLVFDSVSNIAMPLGGLGFALYCGWRLGETTRRGQFPEGFSWRLYRAWLLVLRWLVPAAVSVVFLHAVGLV